MVDTIASMSRKVMCVSLTGTPFSARFHALMKRLPMSRRLCTWT